MPLSSFYTNTLPNNDANAIWASASVYTYKSDVTINNQLHHIYGRDANTSHSDIKVNTVTDVWSDSGADHPETVNDVGVFTLSNGNVILKYPNESSSTVLYSFSKPSGLSVTSITVANEIASTRQFTVTHTGTLSASDITYRINGANIASLGSPNTPITNLQTTSTGSTFDSYTVAKYGSHSITIDAKTLNFWVSSSGTMSTGNELANANITVTFPATEALWNAHVANSYDYVDIYSTDMNYFGRLHNGDPDDPRVVQYVRIGTQYKSNSNASLRGFTYVVHTYVYRPTYSFTESSGYIDPVALNESTGSPNTTFDLPAHFISGDINSVAQYPWTFASVNEQQDTNTSNGGGKPDRYPLIMTNLFNRNRSLYSIGMTHKDTWDLFL